MLGSGTQKQRADLLSSSAASFTETKATISPLPGLGWITVCQSGCQVCICAPSPFTTSHPYYLFFHLILPLPVHERIMNVPSNLTFSESTQLPSFTSFNCHHPPRLWWLSTKCTLTPQWLWTGADVREDQKVGQQMLWANRTAPDWAKATRHSKALNTGSDRSNCSNGVIYTVDLGLPCCLAELTGIQSIINPTVHMCFHLFELCFSYIINTSLKSNKLLKNCTRDVYIYCWRQHTQIWFWAAFLG